MLLLLLVHWIRANIDKQFATEARRYILKVNVCSLAYRIFCLFCQLNGFHSQQQLFASQPPPTHNHALTHTNRHEHARTFTMNAAVFVFMRPVSLLPTHFATLSVCLLLFPPVRWRQRRLFDAIRNTKYNTRNSVFGLLFRLFTLPAQLFHHLWQQQMPRHFSGYLYFPLTWTLDSRSGRFFSTTRARADKILGADVTVLRRGKNKGDG